jgi:hypothetical protein
MPGDVECGMARMKVGLPALDSFTA